MKPLSDYITDLDFDYVISYSGIRNELFDQFKRDTQGRIRQLERELESARYMEKPKLSAEINKLKNSSEKFNILIIDQNGKLHPSAEAIERFESSDDRLKEILEILNRPLTQSVVSGCMAVYRDALAFYSKVGEIKGILHVCFECCWMKNEKEEILEADISTYELLQAKLIDVGHNIELE